MGRKRCVGQFGGLRAGRELTMRVDTAEDYEPDSDFGYNETSGKLLVDSGAFGPYFKDRFGLKEHLSDYVRFEERHELTTPEYIC